MPMIFVEGGNFSGRTAHLRRNASEVGVYLHPDLELNLSGFAETVEGEGFLHGLPVSSDGFGRRRLRTLSGGERARLVLDCALARRPVTLSVDCVLEQLDGPGRRSALEMLEAHAGQRLVWLSDNDLDPSTFSSREAPPLERKGGAIDFNRPLLEATRFLTGSAQAPAIRARGLRFAYPRSTAPVFCGVDFDLHAGSIYLLKAPNGAGKSTLARLLVGLLRPQSGCLEAGHRLLASGSGPLFYAFQNARDQVFGRTPLEYLAEVTRLGGQRESLWPKEWESPEDLLNAFGLSTFMAVETWDLPPVALKRLGLAAAFASRAPWIFLDEPALGLDSEGRAALQILLATAAARGRGVIVVSHGKEFDGAASACGVTIADRNVLVGVG